MAQLQVLRDKQSIEALSTYLKDFDFVAYDCETTGLLRTDQIIGLSVCAEEDKAFYVVLSEWDASKQELVDLGLYDAAKHLVSGLLKHKLVMHNAVFDCSMAEAFFKVRLIDALHTDTMVLAHLLDENRRVGLKELGRTMYGEDSNKEAQEMEASVLANGGVVTKANYEMYKADSELLGKYGAQDAALTYRLFTDLAPKLFEAGLDEFFYNEESMPLLKGPTYDLNTTGLKVDMAELLKLKQTLKAECLEAEAFIRAEIKNWTAEKYPGTNTKNTFNLGSSPQLAWLCFGVLNLEFGTLTDGGKDVCHALGLKLPYTKEAKRDFIRRCLNSVGWEYVPPAIVNGKTVRGKKIKEPWSYIKCDKKVLQKYAPKYPWIETLLSYQRKKKILDTYLTGIEKRVQYGVISPSFLQTGTTSGRYASMDPNFQNLPRDDKRVKQLIIPRPGKVFVGADQSQLEPRVFAYYSQDKALMKAFTSTEDFYSVIGMRVFKKTDCTPHKEGSPDAFGIKYKRLRDLSKVIALAATYGSTARLLSSTTGKSVEDTQQDIDDYFEAFPGVKNYMNKMRDDVRRDGVVYNLFGRPRRIPEALHVSKKTAHEDLPYEHRNLLNLAVNYPIQGTGASIMNRACIRLHSLIKELGLSARIVCQVHDSVIVECDEKDAENISIIMQECLETTAELPGVALEAIPKIGKNFAEV